MVRLTLRTARTSTSPDLLNAVRPAFGLISDGFENSYGHPHPLTLKSLNEHRIAVYRTDERGLIRMSSDGKRIRGPNDRNDECHRQRWQDDS